MELKGKERQTLQPVAKRLVEVARLTEVVNT